MWSKGCLLFWDKKQVPWSLCQEKWSGLGSSQIMDWNGSLNILTGEQRTKLGFPLPVVPSLTLWNSSSLSVFCLMSRRCKTSCSMLSTVHPTLAHCNSSWGMQGVVLTKVQAVTSGQPTSPRRPQMMSLDTPHWNPNLSPFWFGCLYNSFPCHFFSNLQLRIRCVNSQISFHLET